MLITKYLLVFLLLFISDVLWTLYIRWSSRGLAVRAALTSVFIWAASAWTFLEFIDDRFVIIPASVGAFLGTYLTIKFDK